MKLLNKVICSATLFCSLSASGQWTQSGTGNPSGLTHCFIESSGVLFSGGVDAYIYSSTDNGDTWSPSNAGITAGEEILCFGKNSAGIFAGSGSKIYFSNNNGNSWAIVKDSAQTFSFAFLTDTVYAAAMKRGVLMSPDNGLTWTPLNSGLNSDSVYSIVAKGNLLFAGTVTHGVFISSNSGLSWSAVNTGLPSQVHIRCLETDGTNLYAGTRFLWGPVPPYGMFISSDDGSSWSQVTSGISTSSSVFGITHIGNAILAASGDVYRSLDQGLTWSIFMTGIDTTCPYGSTGFLETSSYVFCGMEGGCGLSIYRIDKNEVLLSLENQTKKTPVSVFPNPTNGKFLLRSDVHKGSHSQFTIKNVLGKEVFHSSLIIQNSSFEIDLSNEADGIYYFFFYDNGGVIASEKLVLVR